MTMVRPGSIADKSNWKVLLDADAPFEFDGVRREAVVAVAG